MEKKILAEYEIQVSGDDHCGSTCRYKVTDMSAYNDCEVSTRCELFRKKLAWNSGGWLRCSLCHSSEKEWDNVMKSYIKMKRGE